LTTCLIKDMGGIGTRNVLGALGSYTVKYSLIPESSDCEST